MNAAAETEYIPTKEVAVLIRRELRTAFPGIKFGVKTHSYAGGSHVNVRWEDGPSARQIDAVIGRFHGRTFDGMDDSTHYHESEHEGRRVHFGGSAPSTYRHVSNEPARRALATAMILAKCVCEGEPGRERFGNDWVDTLASGMVHAADYRRPDAEALPAAFRRVVLREEG